MIEPEIAWQRLTPFIVPLGTSTVARRDGLGKVLATALDATLDVPATDVSAMDGFALGAQVDLETWNPIRGMIAAGDPPPPAIDPGAVWRIMTGAPAPAGTERVIPVELAEVRSADERSSGPTDVQGEAVRFPAAANPPPAGAHIRRQAEILSRGDLLLPVGSQITPGALSLLATHGIERLEVYRPPRVALIVTGDEVVPPDREPGPGQLRDSHTDFVLGACRSLGIEAEPLGIAPDRVEPLTEMIERGLEADVLLLTGGVSMGELDLVEGALARLGCRTLFEKVAVQPGKPLVAAERGADGDRSKTLVFGLPGNPASVMVGFWLFVRPALRSMMGLEDGFWHGALPARLAGPLIGAKGRQRYVPGRVRFAEGRIDVLPQPPKGSHDLAAYGVGTALIRVPAHQAPRSAGEACEVLPLADWRTTGFG